MLADMHSRRARGDRLKRASHFRRSLRLQIEHVEMTGSASQKNQDHAASTFLADRRGLGGSRLLREDSGPWRIVGAALIVAGVVSLALPA